VIGLVELAGLTVIVGALAQAAVSVAFAAWRAARMSVAQRARLEQLRLQVSLLLETARHERNRQQWSWSGLRKLVIDEKVQEAEGIYSFYLRAHDQQPLPSFKPGQHLTCHLRVPGQSHPVVRCYSLSDCPRDDGRYRLTVKRIQTSDGRTGIASGHLCQRLAAGDIINVEAPSGSFYLDLTDQRPIVLIAGGIGLTPLLAMVNAVAAAASKRELRLFYGVRNPAQQVMKEHLQELAAQHPSISLTLCYSHPPADLVTDATNHHGRIDIDLLKNLLPSSNYLFYLCGPPAMMQELRAGLLAWGVPASDIHFEAFGPASAAEPATISKDTTQQVEFARSAISCQWTSDQGSLLDLGEANGVPMSSGCRAGSCGSCATAIREGKVRYTIKPGAEPDEGSCLACIAVPDGPVVLDA
jgi:ferredoxin-NADP reductase